MARREREAGNGMERASEHSFEAPIVTLHNACGSFGISLCLFEIPCSVFVSWLVILLA